VVNGRLRKFMELDSYRRRALWRAFGALRAARRELKRRPFRDLVGTLQPVDAARGESVIGPHQQKRAGDIGWAVRTASRYAPFDSSCLVQVLAARAMLRTAGIAGTIYIGAGQSEDASDEKFAAHAWLKCGDAFVTGEAGHERYAIIGVVSW
jgi:hypothetical protein